MSSPNDQPESRDAALAVYVHNLHVAYETNVILHGLDVEIPVGQVVALTGANGSGKSTFVKALMSSAPVRGKIEIFGRSARGGRPFRRNGVQWDRIGYVPQRPPATAAVSSTAFEVVRSGLLGRRRWWYTPGSKEAALAALRTVGLAHREGSPVQVLSGGQYQRVRIARALVREPDLFILDEPLAGIDRHSQDKLADIIATLKAAGKTIVLVLHELGPIEPHLDRVINLAGGHITYDGPVAGFTPGHHDDHHFPRQEMDFFGGGLND